MSTQTEPPANPNKELWEKGDFTRIAAAMRDSGEALVATLGVNPGLDILDLGCGSASRTSATTTGRR
jgi:cyclopropane fatty-acyl-phospholipid synthase-like methyltransferase